MTEKEKLIRDITTIRESINRDWADLSSILSLSHDDRTAIRTLPEGKRSTPARLRYVKATHVRFGAKADICSAIANVRFAPESVRQLLSPRVRRTIFR